VDSEDFSKGLGLNSNRWFMDRNVALRVVGVLERLRKGDVESADGRKDDEDYYPVTTDDEYLQEKDRKLFQ